MTGYQPAGFRMIRFAPDGQRDMAFGTNGVLSTPWPGDAVIADLALRASGGFVAVGQDAPDGRHSLIAASAYDTSGALDPSFGSNGRRLYHVGSGQNYGTAVAELPAGDLLFGVVDHPGHGGFFCYVLRTTASGALVTTFGTGGKAQVSATETEAGINSMLVDGDDVMFTLSVEVGPFISELDAVNVDTGTRDAGFGTDGALTLDGYAVSWYGADAAGRLYDDGFVEQDFGPAGILQRRLID
jgi:hypothetical protein